MLSINVNFVFAENLIQVSPLSGQAPLEVSMRMESVGGKFGHTLYLDFGDGTENKLSDNTSYTGTILHTYTNSGVYTVKLKDRDNSSQCGSGVDWCRTTLFQQNVKVVGPNLQKTVFLGNERFLSSCKLNVLPFFTDNLYLKYGVDTSCRAGFECYDGNDQVSILQGFLASYYNLPQTFPTGIFGSRTDFYVQKFKKEYGLTPVSTVGPATISKIKEVCRLTSNDVILARDPSDSAVVTFSISKNLKNSFNAKLTVSKNGRENDFMGLNAWIPERGDKKVILVNDRKWYRNGDGDNGCSSTNYYTEQKLNKKYYSVVLNNNNCDMVGGSGSDVSKKFFSDIEIVDVLKTLKFQ